MQVPSWHAIMILVEPRKGDCSSRLVSNWIRHQTTVVAEKILLLLQSLVAMKGTQALVRGLAIILKRICTGNRNVEHYLQWYVTKLDRHSRPSITHARFSVVQTNSKHFRMECIRETDELLSAARIPSHYQSCICSIISAIRLLHQLRAQTILIQHAPFDHPFSC